MMKISTPAGPRRVLLAEDDGLVRESLKVRLTSAGYEVHVARTGNEALKQLVSIKPDVLVLDLGMPDMDGFDVLRVLRDELPYLKVPALVLTARQRAEDVRRALSLGARDYVVKSRSDADLLRRLERLFRPAAAA